LLYEKIDTIQGIAKTDSMIELGCAFKETLVFKILWGILKQLLKL
jgi:hypothetical protein